MHACKPLHTQNNKNCFIIIGGIDLKEMLEALVELTVQWFMLGICLKMEPANLLNIRGSKKNATVEECKIEMLIKWSEQQTPTWEKLVKALIKMKMHSIAATLLKVGCILNTFRGV